MKTLVLSLLILAGTPNNSFYKDKVVPGTESNGTGVSCCTKKDCVPLKSWRQTFEGKYQIYMPQGYWHTPPQRIVRVEHTPDGQAHACYHEHKNMSYSRRKVTVFCVWIPIPSV